MSLSAEERVRIDRAIAGLQAKISEARTRLISEQSFNGAAWAEYGSELCAGEMQAKEREISEEIEDFERDVALLRRCLAGEVPTVSDEAFIREGFALDAEEKALAAKREAYQKRRYEIIQTGALLLQHARG